MDLEKLVTSSCFLKYFALSELTVAEFDSREYGRHRFGQIMLTYSLFVPELVKD